MRRLKKFLRTKESDNDRTRELEKLRKQRNDSKKARDKIVRVSESGFVGGE